MRAPKALFKKAVAVLALVASIMLTARPAHAQCLANELQKLNASQPAQFDSFGRTVAVSGDVAVIGAHRHDTDAGAQAGSAYVYRLVAGNWIEQTMLTASDAAAGDWLGYSVAIDGDVIVIGAIGDDDRGSASGSAYVFRFNGADWVEEGKVVASDGTRDDLFGTSVAVSQNTVLVGAPLNELTLPGWAYVYRFNGGEWTEEAKLVPSDGEDRDDFGIAVAVQGDTAVVGAWNEGNTGLSFPDGTGAAYVFRFNGSAWSEQTKLVSTDPLPGQLDRFGASVSMDNDRILVGTDPISFGPPDPAGSAYIFRRNGNDWVVESKLVSSDAQGGDRFGTAVSLSGDLALIGAWGEWSTGDGCSFPDLCQSGSAYAFRFNGSNWVEQAKLVSSDIAEDDSFGWSLAVSHGAAIIGAWRDDDFAADSGSAYYFPGLSDCNANGALDICDITGGTSLDTNANGIPDECECAADLDGDGDTDQGDLGVLLSNWGCTGGDCAGDLDGDGDTDQADLGVLLSDWGCPNAP